MISARRISFLGMDEPLSAHMLATLGIWPDGLAPRGDVVFSLQEAGDDAVFSLQFPGATAAVVSTASGGWGYLPIPEPIRERARGVPRIVQQVEDAQRRASEIAAAAVARAAAIEAPASLADVMQVWAAPVSLTVLVASSENLPLPAENLPPFAENLPFAAADRRLPPLAAAALDEDAILAASILLMRRRR